MNNKTIKRLYWVFTLLLVLFLLFDGIGGVTRQQAGVEVMQHLGYPVYFLSIAGIAKLLSVPAILQSKYITIKEWAYAGNAFNFIGAFMSRSFVGDPVFDTVFPLFILAFMLVSYFLWKRIVMETVNAHKEFAVG